jgi:hypothetical protein
LCRHLWFVLVYLLGCPSSTGSGIPGTFFVF